MELSDIPTPALLLDKSKLERNIERMAKKALKYNVDLRPHIKTHKCVEVAQIQQAAGIQGITVSTLKEAEVFAAHGFSDITYAVPIEQSKFSAFTVLNDTIGLKAVIDSEDVIASLNRTAMQENQIIDVLVQVDMGYHRCGIDSQSASSAAIVEAVVTASNLQFKGILTHAGNSYECTSVECIKEVAKKEQEVMVTFADRLRSHGEDFNPEIVSIGSTPTISLCDDITSGITEMRPGNYAYFDYTQTKLGSCEVADCALTVLAGVVGIFKRRLVIDAGATALSKDRGPVHIEPDCGYGKIFSDYQNATLDAEATIKDLSQEHGKVSLGNGSSLQHVLIGGKIRILPNHSCLTNNLFRKVYVMEGDTVIAEWKIHSGHS